MGGGVGSMRMIGKHLFLFAHALSLPNEIGRWFGWMTQQNWLYAAINYWAPSGAPDI